EDEPLGLDDLGIGALKRGLYPAWAREHKTVGAADPQIDLACEHRTRGAAKPAFQIFRPGHGIEHEACGSVELAPHLDLEIGWGRDFQRLVHLGVHSTSPSSLALCAYAAQTLSISPRPSSPRARRRG